MFTWVLTLLQSSSFARAGVVDSACFLLFLSFLSFFFLLLPSLLFLSSFLFLSSLSPVDTTLSVLWTLGQSYLPLFSHFAAPHQHPTPPPFAPHSAMIRGATRSATSILLRASSHSSSVLSRARPLHSAGTLLGRRVSRALSVSPAALRRVGVDARPSAGCTNAPHLWQRRFFSAEGSMVVKVPSMGDSITDGDIVEWVKGVDDVVLVDDIIVIIETDKVNVEVRSEHNGKILEVMGEEGDNVEVGHDLLVLELMSAEEAAKLAGDSASAPEPKEASSSSPPPPPPTSDTASSSSSSSASSPATPAVPHRQPLIRFRHGDREAIDQEIASEHGFGHEQASGSSSGGGGAAAPSSKSSVGVEAMERPSSMFARKPLSEEEISIIVSGGASEWD